MTSPAPTNTGTQDPTPGSNGNPGGTPPSQQPPAAQFTQDQVDRLIKDRLEQERKVQADKIAKDAADAETKRLADEKQFQELAAKHETRVKELEPQVATLQGQYTALATRNNAMIDAAIAAWPDEIKALVPAPDTDVARRLEAYDTARAILEKFAPGDTTPPNQPRPRPAANRPGPAPASGGPSTRDRAEAEQRASGRYTAL